MSHGDIDPVHALHTDAKNYPGGITALAVLVGRSAGTLHNKFSSATDQCEITDREADAIARAVRNKTGTQGYIDAKCALHGGLFVLLPDDDGAAADDDVLSALLESMRSLGDLARELSEARADGLITPDEFAAIELRGRRLQASIQHAIGTLRTQVVERPASIRQVK